MTRRLALVGFSVLVAVLLLLAAWWWRQGPTVGPAHQPEALPPAALPAPVGEAFEVDLYFPNGQGLLSVERRALALPEDQSARSEAVLRALLEGPRSANLFAPFPPEVEVTRVVLGGGGLLYVDLSGGAAPPAAGSAMETLRVWSVVNTVLAAAPTATAAVITWNGAQIESLGGHVDTGRPLTARAELVAASP